MCDTLAAFARFVSGLALWLCVLCPAGALHPAAAQSSYPDKPIRIINPFPAGSPVDYVGRLIANKLELAFGQPVVVESRSGAGGTVGANAVAKSAGDGYTLLVTSPSTLASAPALVKSLAYDPLRDFAGIWAVSSSGLVAVVNPALPIRTLNQSIASGKLRALAILRPKRNGLVPDVPTSTEAGAPGNDTTGWIGLFAPAATPKEITAKLTEVLGSTMNDPDTVRRLVEAGNDNDFLIGDALQRRLADDIRLFAEIVAAAGIKPE